MCFSIKLAPLKLQKMNENISKIKNYKITLKMIEKQLEIKELKGIFKYEQKPIFNQPVNQYVLFKVIYFYVKI